MKIPGLLTSISRIARFDQWLPVTFRFRTLGSNIALSCGSRIIQRNIRTSVSSVRSDWGWRRVVFPIFGLGKVSARLLSCYSRNVRWSATIGFVDNSVSVTWHVAVPLVLDRGWRQSGHPGQWLTSSRRKVGDLTAGSQVYSMIGDL